MKYFLNDEEITLEELKRSLADCRHSITDWGKTIEVIELSEVGEDYLSFNKTDHLIY